MSETDDTDVLLLIPPDFFLVPSSDESSILDTPRTVVSLAPTSRRSLAALHASIGSLEHRVASLELSTSPRTLNSSNTSGKVRHSSLDRIYGADRGSFTFPRRRRRKFLTRKRRTDVSLASTRSSSFCEDSVPPLSLSLSGPTDSEVGQNERNNFTMDSELSSVVSSPSKKTDKLLLNEIDEFLNKVESYECPNTDLNSSDYPENLIQATAEYISQKIENSSNRITLPSGRTVPSDFLDKYIYLVKNPQSNPSTSRQNKVEQQEASQEVTPQQNENLSRLPDMKSNSARKLNFESSQTTSTPNANRLVRGNTVPNIETSFRPSNKKLYKNASKILDQYKMDSLLTCDTVSNISSYRTPKKDCFKNRKYAADRTEANRAPSTKYPNSIDTDLLSLSELWNDREGHKSDLVAKLEEERLKREHCEAVIQELQKKTLSQQEKIAVAMKVDRAKDNAISRLRDAWLRITSNLEAAESRHKSTLEKINEEISKLKQYAEESQKKTQHFENEMYKTLDLAHDYQEKCKMAQKEKRDIELQMDRLQVDKAEELRKKDEEIENLKENNEAVMRLNKQLTDCVKNAEETLEKEKCSHTETRTELSAAHKLTQSYQEELTLLQQERDVLKEKMKEERARVGILEKQVCEAQGRLMDAQKNEKNLDNEVKSLRKHLEIQKEDLKTYYQKQLEEAVLAKLLEFQQQLDSAEREMERDAREKENHVVDTYNKRIHMIEEQHKLEVTVMEEKQKEEIKLYRLQLAQCNEKIAALETKVESYRRRRGQMASQLHSVMESQWRQALDILTGQSASADTSTHRSNNQMYPPHSTPESKQPLLAPGHHRFPCEPPGLDKKSVTALATDRKLNTDGLSDVELQRYVKMLLTKPPDLYEDDDADISLTSRQRNPLEEPTSDRPPDDDRADKQSKRSLINKPPWKGC